MSVVMALMLMTVIGTSTDASAQTAAATATRTATAAPAAAKTGNAGLVQSEGAGVMLPGALAVGTVVLLASGWYVVGKRRA